ncbi:hypothetical protein [Bailinhaonella thermotolerans]|uniref:hypothetical protein n=1 Tax=Bailinhaonella thermotolerans TaxID=1070861 RepID=UPI00192A3317|nr:hypothetical protein [Bailinhaonella thermotolerans]
MDGPLLAVVVAVVVIGVIVKRFVGEPLNARDLGVPPVVLVGIGVHGLVTDVRPSGVDLLWVVIGCVVGLVFGALRGLTPRLFARRGHLWQRYTAWTLLVWAVSAAANFGVGALATASGTPEQARPLTLSIGVSLLGEAIVLGLRALATGVPFAPETRSGPAPHRSGTAAAGPPPGPAGPAGGGPYGKGGQAMPYGAPPLLEGAMRTVARWARDRRG